MQDLELKKCTKEDIPELRSVALQSYQEHYMYLWTEERYVQWYMEHSFGVESLLNQMSNPNAVFFLILYQNSPAGFIKINLNKALEGYAADKSLELERIYLLNEVSGKGIGTEAMRRIIDDAIKTGKELVWLKSMDSSPALNFYQKLGFKKQAVEKLPFDGFKDEYRNIVTMCLVLSN